MNAIVVTSELCGWGFTPAVNVSRLLRRSRSRPRRGEATEADFIEWMKRRVNEPARIEIMSQFDVSRATAYRWLAAWRQREIS